MKSAKTAVRAVVDSVLTVVMVLLGVGPEAVAALVTAHVQQATVRGSVRLVVMDLPVRVAVHAVTALRVSAATALQAHAVMALRVKVVARAASVIAIAKMPARSANG